RPASLTLRTPPPAPSRKGRGISDSDFHSLPPCGGGLGRGVNDALRRQLSLSKDGRATVRAASWFDGLTMRRCDDAAACGDAAVCECRGVAMPRDGNSEHVAELVGLGRHVAPVEAVRL